MARPLLKCPPGHLCASLALPPAPVKRGSPPPGNAAWPPQWTVPRGAHVLLGRWRRVHLSGFASLSASLQGGFGGLSAWLGVILACPHRAACGTENPQEHSEPVIRWLGPLTPFSCGAGRGRARGFSTQPPAAPSSARSSFASPLCLARPSVLAGPAHSAAPCPRTLTCHLLYPALCPVPHLGSGPCPGLSSENLEKRDS